ncbi:MAG TPA: UDP-N-acetylglucosamine 2-epimerase (non-hydrolyzing) [Candidatus Ozemobacteraceae bacterium]
MTTNLLFILGTRPEVVKLAPVIREARSRTGVTATVLHTGQHREMAAEMFDLFGIRPDIDLAVMQPNQTLFSVSAKILEGLEAVLRERRFDAILVQGDTTTAFLGALAGYYTKTRVAHVEAGLRTHDKLSPYPEEMNRRLAGALADLHFPPTPRAKNNLLAEGIPAEKIIVTGNTVIDALLWALEMPYEAPADLAPILATPGRLVLVTTHRRESFGEPHRRVFQAFLQLAEAFPDVRILFPVHPNPNVRAEVAHQLGNHPRIHLVAPLGYLDFIHAMQAATIILSDSGGVQEEAPSLKKPVLVLRDHTERPEGIESGCLKLVGTVTETIFEEARKLLTDASHYHNMIKSPNPYGDGTASKAIIDNIITQ